MQVRFQSQLNFKGNFPFNSSQEEATIIDNLRGSGISYKKVGNEIITGKTLVNYNKQQALSSAAVDKFEYSLKTAIAEFKNGVRRV